MKNSCIVLLIYLHFTFLQADLSKEDYAHLMRFSTKAQIEDIHTFSLPQQCAQILNSFAEYASNFTKCSIQHARPIRLCEKCVEQYTQFHKKYDELLTTVVNGTSCKSMFISCDRLDAVLQYHDSIMAVWDKGNCNACFDWSKKTPELLNSTKRFYSMFNETMACIVNNLNPVGNDSDVCEKCMQPYLQLDEFYRSLSKDGIGVDCVCFDVVDSMNATRSIWSKSLNCCKLRRTPEIIFLASTAVISLLPLLFYLAVRYCGPIQDLPNVLKQSRIKQTIMRSLEERFN